MEIKFTIEGRLPGLNEMLREAKSFRLKYSHFKREWTDYCGIYIRKARLPVFTESFKISVHWIEPNKKRDLDNICAGIKFILDAMVSTERISNDNQKQITGIVHTFGPPDKVNPKIEVTLFSMSPAV